MQETDASGTTTTVTYDLLGRPVQRSAPDGDDIVFDAETSALRHPPGVARPGASAGPIDGQPALDVSLQIGENTSRRIGIDYARKEFVIFDEHTPGMFHGHIRTWAELTPAMQTLLRRWGITDRRDTILVGEE